MSIQVKLTRPIFKAVMNYEISYKVRSNFYQTIINVTFNVCEVLNGTADNPMFQWIIGFMSPNFKTLLHSCPYKDMVNFFNLYVDLKGFISKFPSGTYMGCVTFFDDQDEIIFKFKYTQEMISNDHAEF
ncbi:hypothetical protein PVAND_015572 [Polypedilum vanderplanki]|uniref:Uncharacterized protein n=1 Tax=Polypedilum vanderplanki TaxID=319348 RepID=A0A9J6BCN0_POLVA|nr:hypothetical protein PVAND_015572 [Polypedilum vanderplanki]